MSGLSEGLSPIFAVALVWFVLYRLFSALRKQGKGGAGTRSPGKGAGPQVKVPPPAPEVSSPHILRVQETKPAPPQTPPREAYQGSLNFISPEGIDPCHEEQMQTMDAFREENPSSPAPASGLNLSWTANDLVRGFVYSEVLRRKGKGA